MSTILTIADAVVARLNDGSINLPLSAERRYQPAFDLADLAALKVSVVPRSMTISNATRTDGYFDCAIDIGVQKKIAAAHGRLMTGLGSPGAPARRRRPILSAASMKRRTTILVLVCLCLLALCGCVCNAAEDRRSGRQEVRLSGCPADAASPSPDSLTV